MHQFAYSEILEESGSECRRHEREAFDKVIALLHKARERGAASIEAVEAVYRLRLLWRLLLDDLSSPQNSLPDVLKASLISIGIWMLKEMEKVRDGQEEALDAIIAINTIIRDGLK